jgi:2-hydroxychromene-2-carboxylate isomerase
MRIVHYFDYKSPYAYLAQDATFALAEETGAVIDFLPYTLDIPSYLGNAEVDATKQVLFEQRNAHQWRRVRYSYMDCRREADRRGMVIRGPRKIFDSSLAHVGFLWAKQSGEWRRYHEAVFLAFWRRELDIEDPAVIRAVLERSGVAAAGFEEFLAGEGRRELDRLRVEAEERGVFGVPSYLLAGELFWGAERIERVRERLLAR